GYSGSQGDGGTEGSHSTSAAFRWTAAAGMEYAGGFAATAISADGAVVVGYDGYSSGWGPGASWAFRWTPEMGSVVIGPVCYFRTGATGVSANGSAIIGSASDIGSWLWDTAHDRRDLAEVLVGLGVGGTEDWTLGEAAGISADGRTIIGTGINPVGRVEAWI